MESRDFLLLVDDMLERRPDVYTVTDLRRVIQRLLEEVP